MDPKAINVSRVKRCTLKLNMVLTVYRYCSQSFDTSVRSAESNLNLSGLNEWDVSLVTMVQRGCRKLRYAIRLRSASQTRHLLNLGVREAAFYSRSLLTWLHAEFITYCSHATGT